MLSNRLYTSILFFFICNILLGQNYDTSFNGTGYLSLDIEGKDKAENFFLQKDGKILIAGSSEIGSPIFGDDNVFLARLNTDGSLDTSFSEDGKLQIEYNSQTFYIGSYLTDDQKILLLTWHLNLGVKVVNLTKFNTDGSIDDSFGDNGVMEFFKEDDFYYHHSASFFEYDNKIYFLLKYTNKQSDPIETRLYSMKNDGSFDDSFGNNGYLDIDFGFHMNYMANPVIYKNKLYINGLVNFLPAGETSYKRQLMIVKINFDGTFDSSFGNGGYITNDITAYADLIVQDDDKIVCLGSTGGNQQGTSGDISMVRFLSNGDVDTTFGNNGIFSTSIDTYEDTASEMAILDNGDFIVGGSFFDFAGGSGFDGMLFRVTSDGEFDEDFASTYGYPGVFDVGITSGTDAVNHLIKTDNNTIFTMGTGNFYSPQSFNVIIQKINIEQSLSNQNYDLEKILKIYPNPVEQNFSIKGIKKKYDYFIYDSLGKEVQKGSVSPDQYIKINTLNNGVYFLKVNEQIHKIIKK